MDMSVSQILEEISKLDNKISKLDNRFDDQEKNFNKRFEKIDKRFDEQKGINKLFALQFLKIDKRFEKLENQMAKNHNQVLMLDSMSGDIKDLKQEKVVIVQQYKRLDKKVDKLAKSGIG